MKKVDLMEDVSVLTTLPKQTLLKIEKKKAQCIAHSVLENQYKHLPTTCISTGLGDIYINVSDTDIEYKFVPNNFLEKNVLNAVTKQESPLVRELDENLVKKITQAYKDLF